MYDLYFFVEKFVSFYLGLTNVNHFNFFVKFFTYLPARHLCPR